MDSGCRTISDGVGGAEVDGMLTVVEVSSAGQGTLEFFDETSVIAVMHEP
jgi:hypothetical protein